MRASQLPTAGRTATRTQRLVPASSDGLDVLGRYRLIRRLGAGGFGTVWLARDDRLDREVAVKIVPRERVIGGRFEREARAAARLAHPAIVTLYEAGADDDGAYLVSELVRGATLAALLDAGRLSDRDIVEIGVSLCDALAHAHSQGVVHRDVKPSNVLVPDPVHPAHGRGAPPVQVAKLTDFGVARVLGGDTLTRTGDVVGTAAYMAPEQAEGLPAGAQADLYSLALVLYEGLTGVNPIRTSAAAQRTRRLGAHLPPLRRQRRDLPRELGQGLDLALRPRPRERGSIDDLRAALIAGLTTVSDEAGVVTGRWPTRADRHSETVPDSDPLAAAADSIPDPRSRSPIHAAPVPLPERVLAGIVAAALAAWLATHVLHSSPLGPAAVALASGVLVMLLPRLGWVALAVALVTTLALQQRPGAALVLGVAALVPLVALPLSGGAWPLSACAPGLGAISLAGAWPALAARAGNPWRRAALGLTGWVWLAVAEPLTGTRLYLGRPRGAPAPAVWEGSLHRTIHDVLGPLLSSGVLAPAVVWAAAAVVLPLLVRGRSVAVDVVRVVVWSAVLVSATSTSIALASGNSAQPTPRGPVLGALAGVALALAPTAVGLRRGSQEARAGRSRLP